MRIYQSFPKPSPAARFEIPFRWYPKNPTSWFAEMISDSNRAVQFNSIRTSRDYDSACRPTGDRPLAWPLDQPTRRDHVAESLHRWPGRTGGRSPPATLRPGPRHLISDPSSIDRDCEQVDDWVSRLTRDELISAPMDRTLSTSPSYSSRGVQSIAITHV